MIPPFHQVWAGAANEQLREAFAFLVRSGDAVRQVAFLKVQAKLETQERLLRELAVGTAQRRAAVIWAVAADLYLGYKTLNERSRLFPGLVREADWETQHRHGAGRVLDAAESLGGALIKAGQFASTRPDLLPQPYVERLSSLQDRLPPRPWPEIRSAIERELGRPLPEAFAGIDPEPLSAASIAQVHRARLKNGREVAVKVQYPEVAALIGADLAALENVFGGIATLEPAVRLQPIADYLRWTLPLELDFTREARACGRLREALSDREDVLVPEVVPELTTGRLLVMELVEGIKITDRTALEAAGIDPRATAELLNDLYADQLFERGVLHADPHPGNVLARPGPQLVLLDHGLTLELDPDLVSALRGLVAALGSGDPGSLNAALRRAGVPLEPNADISGILQVVGVLLGGSRDDTAELLDLGRSLGTTVSDIPPKLLLAGRAIGLLDGITRQLAPEVDALEIVGRYVR